jgi:hypothetical protein
MRVVRLHLSPPRSLMPRKSATGARKKHAVKTLPQKEMAAKEAAAQSSAQKATSGKRNVNTRGNGKRAPATSSSAALDAVLAEAELVRTGGRSAEPGMPTCYLSINVFMLTNLSRRQPLLKPTGIRAPQRQMLSKVRTPPKPDASTRWRSCVVSL